MNKYGWGAWVAFGAALAVALIVVLAGDAEGIAIRNAVGLLVTIPLTIMFFPLVVRAVRGRGRNGTPLLARDLFGAGTSLFSAGLAIGLLRGVFFDKVCGMDTGCFSWVLGIQVLLWLAGMIMKEIAAISFIFPTDGRRRALWSLAGGAVVSLAALFYGLDQIA